MNKTEIVKKASSAFGKVNIKLRKHSPELLIAAGVVGTVVSTVLACKATTKLSTIPVSYTHLDVYKRQQDKYCPDCKEKLKRYDTVKRIVRGKDHSKKLVAIERYKCPKCKTIHRDLPEYLYPFKHYESDIIDGVRCV